MTIGLFLSPFVLVLCSVSHVWGIEMFTGNMSWPYDRIIADKLHDQGMQHARKNENEAALPLFQSASMFAPSPVMFENYGTALTRMGTTMWAVESNGISLLMDPRSKRARDTIKGHLPIKDKPFKLEEVLFYWEGNAFVSTPHALRELGTALGRKGRFEESLRYLWASTVKGKHAVPQTLVNLAVTINSVHDNNPTYIYYAILALKYSDRLQPGIIEGNQIMLQDLNKRFKKLKVKKKKKLTWKNNFFNLKWPEMRVLIPRNFHSPGFHLYAEGVSLQHMGLYTECAVYLKAAINVNTHGTPAYFAQLGSCLAGSGQLQEGKQWLIKALAKQEHFPFAERALKQVNRMLKGLNPKNQPQEEEDDGDVEVEEEDDENNFDFDDGKPISSMFDLPTVEKLDEETSDDISLEDLEKMSPFLQQMSEEGRQADVLKVGQEFERLIEHYEENHRIQTDSSTSVTLKDRRFVVAAVHPYIGIGNALLVIASAFLFGLMTNRALLVYWATSKSYLHHSMTFPAELDWDYVKVISQWDLDEVSRNTQGIEFYSEWQLQGDLNTLACDDYNKAYSAPIIKYFGNQNIVPLMQHNSHYEAEIEKIFGKDIMGPLIRYLIRPAVPAAMTISTMLSKMSSKSAIVGLHVRKGMIAGDAILDTESMAFNVEDRRKTGLVDDVLHCLRKIVDKDKKLKRKDTLVLYIAADRADTRDKIIKEIKADSGLKSRLKIVYNRKVALNRNTIQGHMDAMVDLWMLGRASNVIRSGKAGFSTFSLVGSWLGSNRAHLVLPCSDGHQSCFTEKTGAMRMGTTPMLYSHRQLKCKGGMEPFIDKFTKAGHFMPICEEWTASDKVPRYKDVVSVLKQAGLPSKGVEGMAAQYLLEYQQSSAAELREYVTSREKEKTAKGRLQEDEARKQHKKEQEELEEDDVVDFSDGVVDDDNKKNNKAAVPTDKEKPSNEEEVSRKEITKEAKPKKKKSDKKNKAKSKAKKKPKVEDPEAEDDENEQAVEDKDSIEEQPPPAKEKTKKAKPKEKQVEPPETDHDEEAVERVYEDDMEIEEKPKGTKKEKQKSKKKSVDEGKKEKEEIIPPEEEEEDPQEDEDLDFLNVDYQT